MVVSILIAVRQSLQKTSVTFEGRQWQVNPQGKVF